MHLVTGWHLLCRKEITISLFSKKVNSLMLTHLFRKYVYRFSYKACLVCLCKAGIRQVFWIFGDLLLTKNFEQSSCIKFCVKNLIKCSKTLERYKQQVGQQLPGACRQRYVTTISIPSHAQHWTVFAADLGSAIPLPRLDYLLYIVCIVYYFLYVPKWPLIF